jgi:hypothetical protein
MVIKITPVMLEKASNRLKCHIMRLIIRGKAVYVEDGK